MSDQHNLAPNNNGGGGVVISNRPTLNSSPIGNNSNDRQVQQQQQQQQMHPNPAIDYYESGMPTPHGGNPGPGGAPSPSNNSEGHYMKTSHPGGGGGSSNYSNGPGMRSPSQSQGGSGGMWGGGGPYGHGVPSPHHQTPHGHYGPPPPHMQHGPPPGYGMPPPTPHGHMYGHHGPPPPWQHHPSYMHGHQPPHYPPPYMHQHGPPSAPTPPQQGRRGKDKDGVNKSNSQSPEPNKLLHPKPSTSPSSSDGDVSPTKSPLNSETQMIMVPPMRPDFYFFVQDHKESIIKECKAELPAIYSRLRIPPPSETDATLLFSHINERLIALWESTPSSARQTYMLQEEEDRKRFMNAEEVASQHCATLTARVKSPAFSLEKSKKEEMNVVTSTHEKRSRHLEESPHDMLNPISPTKKMRNEKPEHLNNATLSAMTPHREMVKLEQQDSPGVPIQQETV